MLAKKLLAAAQPLVVLIAVAMAALSLPGAVGEAEAEPLEIVAWGDSLTAGNGASSSAQSYPEQACAMIGACKVYNMGKGGQTSTQIAARQGALPLVIRLRDGRIPADATAAPVSETSVDVLKTGGRRVGSLVGELDGIPGALAADASGNLSFVRQAPGAARVLAGEQVFKPDSAMKLRQAETWIWAGRNNLRNQTIVLRDISAMVASLGHDRYLVGEILPSAKDGPMQAQALLSLNNALRRQYGDHFVPLIEPLQQAGDGSARDLRDIGAGIIPSSLRADRLHLNDQGYQVVATQFVAALRARR